MNNPVTIGRNDPCHCGSGKKYKHCCRRKDIEETKQAKEQAAMAAVSEPLEPPLPAPSMPFAPETIDVDDYDDDDYDDDDIDPRLAGIDRAIDEALAQGADAIDQAYEEFEVADFEGQIAIVQGVIDEVLIDDQMVLDFFDPIYLESIKRNKRPRFAELVNYLRRFSPEIYDTQAGYLTELQIINAVAMGQAATSEGDVLPALVNHLFQIGGEDVDILNRMLDLLGYHGRHDLLVNAIGTEWPLVNPDKHFANAQQDLDLRLIGFQMLAYVERVPPADISKPENLDTLMAELDVNVEMNRDEVLKFLLRTSNQSDRIWTIDDFGFGKPRRKQNSGNVSAALIDNMLALTQEFVGYARWVEGIPALKADLGREEIMAYILQRHDGMLTPQDQPIRRTRPGKKKRARKSKSYRGHPLCPDRETLDRYLSKHFNFFAIQRHRAIACFNLQPVWLRFLEQHQLITADQHQQALESLRGLDTELLKLIEQQPDDPVLLQDLQQWHTNAGLSTEETTS